MAVSARRTATSTPELPQDWRKWPPEAKARLLWRLEARPEQLPPPGDWYVWLILSGRGWGKTRTGAEDLSHYGLTHPGSRLAVVAPTSADARDTCTEGESGLLRCIPKECLHTWNRSLGELILTNGARFKLFSADEPERLRGPQHHRAWCDEVGSWQYPEAFDMLQFGLRLGIDPRVIVTTTPRPMKLVRDLLAAPTTIITRGSTFDNAKNLAPSALAQLKAKYEGTRLGRQELEGELLEDVEGALWQMNWIDSKRVKEAPHLTRIVVAVDPASTHGEDADETGIAVAGRGEDGEFYVLHGAGYRLSPNGWATRTLDLYDQFKADKIIAERNNGGDMVESTIRTVRLTAPLETIVASRGKQVRAEPIAGLYEQGRVHHVGSFPAMEDQMCRFPIAAENDDMVDALVYALTNLDVLPMGIWKL